MAFINRQQGKKKYTGQKKVNINIDLDILDMMISYTLSPNPLVNKKALMNLRRLIESINVREDEFESKWRYDYIKTILEGELDRNIFRNVLLKEHCISKLHMYDNVAENFEGYEDNYLQEADIIFINEYVQEKLTYLYLYEKQEELELALQNLKNSSDRGTNMAQINAQFENIIGTLNKNIQLAKANHSYAAMDYEIGGNTLTNALQTTIDELNRPANHIKTGIQNLNIMLDGGLENGRCYLIFALPKSFKSGLMLNMGIWAAKYNIFQPKDPDKIPVILYVSQENSQRETTERVYTHITGENIKDTTVENAKKVIDDYVIGDRKVQLLIRYRPHKSISTNDLDAMIDDLAMEGKEVVLLIHDYSKRIRSSMNYPDMRLELGEVINDYCTTQF